MFGSKRYVNANHIRVVKSPHEIYFHLLEAMTVTLIWEKGPVRIQVDVHMTDLIFLYSPFVLDKIHRQLLHRVLPQGVQPIQPSRTPPLLTTVNTLICRSYIMRS